MSKQEDTLNKTYGNIPKEIPASLDIFEWIPTYRGVKYYWYKLVRNITR